MYTTPSVHYVHIFPFFSDLHIYVHSSSDHVYIVWTFLQLFMWLLMMYCKPDLIEWISVMRCSSLGDNSSLNGKSSYPHCFITISKGPGMYEKWHHLQKSREFAMWQWLASFSSAYIIIVIYKITMWVQGLGAMVTSKVIKLGIPMVWSNNSM